MRQFKRAQVVILETESKSAIWSNKGRRLYFNQNNPNDIDNEIRYNLYIISDDEIKEGDYWINLDTNTVNSGDLYKLANNAPSCKKIIATTDTSLKVKTNQFGNPISFERELPQPSQQFIQKYIECYNKGEVITDVLVEYDSHPTIGEVINNIAYPGKEIKFLKVNPKDNTITIKKLKDSWNREEIINLIKSFANNYSYASNDIGYNKWIKENL